MKKVIYCVIAAILLVGLVLGCAPAPAPPPPPAPAPTPTPTPPPPTPEPIVLKSLTFLPKDDVSNEGYWYFHNLVNERAKGELIIEWKGGPEAIGMFDQHMAVIAGVVDLFHTPCSFHQGLIPIAAALGISKIALQERDKGIYDYMVEQYEEIGLYYLGRAIGDVGSNLYMTVPIRSPNEVKGLRVRGSPAQKPWMEKLGMVYLSMDMAEIYTALQQGLVAGTTQSWSATYDLGLHEVTEYVCGPEFRPGQVGMWVNLDSFNALPPQLQDLMKNAAIDTEKWVYDHFAQIREEKYQQLKDAGMEFIEWSPEDTKFFLDTVTEALWQDVFEKEPVRGPELKKLYEQ